MPTPSVQDSNYTMRTIVRGNPKNKSAGDDVPHGINKIKVLSDGKRFVTGSNGLTDKSFIMGPRGKILSVFQTPGTDSSLQGVAIDASDNVYQASWWDGNVYKYVAAGGAPILVGRVPHGTGGYTLALNDTEDKLYAADYTTGNGLYEFDVSGALPVTPVAIISNNGSTLANAFPPGSVPFAVARIGFGGIAFTPGSDTEIFCSQVLIGGIGKITFTPGVAGSGVVTTVASVGGVVDVAFRPQDGLLWFTDIGLRFADINPILFKYDTTGASGPPIPVAQIPDFAGNPEGLTFDKHGNVYLASVDRGISEYIVAQNRFRRVNDSILTVPGDLAVYDRASGQTEVFVNDFFKLATFDGRNGDLLRHVNHITSQLGIYDGWSVEVTPKEVIRASLFLSTIIAIFDRDTLIPGFFHFTGGFPRSSPVCARELDPLTTLIYADHQHVSADVEVPYDAKTAIFTAGLVATGGTSGATGTIILDIPVGGSATDGSLYLRPTSGTFVDDEAITDTATGSATVKGAPVSMASKIVKVTRATQAEVDLDTTNFVLPVAILVLQPGASGHQGGSGPDVFISDHGDGTTHATTGGKVKRLFKAGVQDVPPVDVVTGLDRPEGLANDSGDMLVYQASQAPAGGKVTRYSFTGTPDATNPVLIDGLESEIRSAPANLIPGHIQNAGLAVDVKGHIFIMMDRTNELISCVPVAA